MLQALFRMTRLFAVPAGAFRPAPKVDSAVVRLVPLGDAKPDIADVALFARIVAAAFGQRRKTMRNALSTICDEAALRRVGIDPGGARRDASGRGLRAARERARGRSPHRRRDSGRRVSRRLRLLADRIYASMTRSSTDNGIAPFFRTSSWNSRMSNRAPSATFVRSRSSGILSIPLLCTPAPGRSDVCIARSRRRRRAPACRCSRPCSSIACSRVQRLLWMSRVDHEANGAEHLELQAAQVVERILLETSSPAQLLA